MATKTLIVSDLDPNVKEFEALAISDGSEVTLRFMTSGMSGPNFTSMKLSEICLSKKDVEDLLELIDSQFTIENPEEDK